MIYQNLIFNFFFMSSCNDNKDSTISRFTCPEIAVLVSSSFQAVLVFFFLLTHAVIRTLSQLKTLFLRRPATKKRTARKKTARAAILGRVNLLNDGLAIGTESRFN